jgi:hypothetical protein
LQIGYGEVSFINSGYRSCERMTALIDLHRQSDFLLFRNKKYQMVILPVANTLAVT